MNAPLDLAARLRLGATPASAADDAAVCGELLAQLRARVDAPDDETPALCALAFDFLAALPAANPSQNRLECLFAIAQYHYMAARPAEALAPAQLAADLARALDEPALRRKATTFLGVTLTDTGNVPQAIACYAEALEAAGRLADEGAAAPVWNNLGLALHQVGQHREAIRCFERAAELAAGSSQFGLTERSAWSNIASCALQLREPAVGLAAARRAIALNPAPQTAPECLSRAVAESNCARLLLAVGDAQGARQHCDQARAFARRLPAARAEFIAAFTSGVIEVQAGATDVGLTRLKQALEQSRRHLRSELRDALAACVAGYEAAGQPDVALVYLHEILALNRETAQAQIALHQAHHLARVEREAAAGAAQDEVTQRRDALRGRLGSRELLRNRMLLLEQQSVAAELHDDTTGEHCYRVGRLASLLAREIGLEDEVCFLIDLAARLHDIGKLVVPDAILLKPGALTAGERAIMQAHTTAGAEILARSSVPQMHVAQEIALHHHEKWDGTGYPMRLAGSAIPIAARVSALADVFDALTHVRPYKPAWPLAVALAEIRRLRGTHFDPELTDAFLELVPRLQREVGDLDAFLAQEAKDSPFIRARRQIAAALKGNDPTTSLFELHR